jgi:hypothetical protein
MSEPARVMTAANLDGWERLHDALDELPSCLADLRVAPQQRFARLELVMRRIEDESLMLIPKLLACRNEMFPDPRDWNLPAKRHPQPDPTLTLALREWIWSLSAEPSVPLALQKRLSTTLTEILVAREGLATYSKQLCNNKPDDLVRTLNTLWVLVAECWKIRPLLATAMQNTHE